MAAFSLLRLLVAFHCLVAFARVAAQSGDSQVLSIVPRPPVYNLNFSVAPNTLIGATPAWTWSQTDSLDATSVANYHQGVCVLTAATTSYVDLTTATGAQSAGYVIPQWGGPGNTYGGAVIAGWSIEIVVKYNVLPTAGTWAKTFELSDNPATVGSQANNLALSWDNGGDAGDDSGYKLDIEQYTNATASPTASHGIVEMLVPQANTWYHIVLAMAPVGTAGAANWYVYVNGQSLNYATNLALNATLAAINGANYPLYVPRPVSFLGKSAWNGDPYVAATIDAFRLYDYVLPANTVNSLSAAYGISAPPPQTSYVFPSSPEASQTTGIVPTAPIFNAPFAQNPTTAPTVGSTTNYQWLAYDPTDTPANQRLHTGLVVLNGSSGSFINLGTNAGPNSVGMVLPVIGTAGSGSGSTAGLSIEVVFKAVTLPTNTYRGKIFDWGQGASTDNFGMSFENNALGWCLEAQNNWTPAYTYSRWDVASTQVPTAGVWYHMVWVMTNANVTGYTSTWTYYIQGTPVSGTYVSNTVGLYPLPIKRPFSFLGGSDWNDANAALMYDTVRVYDYALTASQVTGLYNLYAPPAVSSSTGPYIPPPCPAGSNAGAGGDGAVMGIVPQRPVYNLNFTQNPACITGLASGWQWAMSDPMDNAATAALHQGVAILAGNSSSWVDLTTASGVQSAGYVIPQWGGPGNSYGNTQMAGWSIEIVVKYNVLPTAGTWAKTFELSDNAATVGSQANNLALSWDNGGDAGDDSGYKLDIEQYTNATASPTASHGIVEMLVPQANTWYHIVLAMAPVGTAGAANWYVYVNGQSLNYATNLALNATLAAINGANYPLYVPRPVSFLGKSAWSDPYVAATIDAFRLYDYVLPANTVNSLSAAYGISAPPPQTSYVFPSSPEASQTTGIVPTAPIFNAPFAQNPTTAPTVGSTTNYQWLAYDPTDTPANQRLHTGLVVLNGSSGSFINLGTNAGPNSVGMVLPVIGTAGSGSGSTAGLSIEVVFKAVTLPTNTYRGKIFDWGQGASTDNFGMSFENNALGWCLEAQNNWTPAYTYSRWDVASTQVPTAGVWYHMVWVMTNANVTGYTSTWTYYIQGTPVSGTYVSNTVGLYPLPIKRPFSFLGGSDWNDANAALMYDTVRVYDYALTASQVTGLYNLYQPTAGSSTGGVGPVTGSCPAGSTAGAGGDGAVMGIVPQRPVYNLNFTQNPACITGLASGWQWAMSDPMDNAATAALHQGVAILAGNSSSWVDLTTASGVQSAGYVIPQWGGPGNSYGNTQMAGWSIEIVVKYNVLPTAGTWAKTFELSDNAATVGSQANNLALSWDNGGDAGDDSGYKLDIEQYTNATASPTASHGIVEMLVPQANTWYHIVLAMAPVGTAGAANWYVYVNGQSLNYATNLALNATLAAINGANYPLYVPRPVSFLGKSAWSDPYVAATIDAFRLYDYVLPANTVNSLSAAYGISAPPPQTSYVFPSSPEASQTTGIVPTAPIFNAPFAQNPTTAPTVGSTTNYQWLAYDPTDTPANQRLHTGLVVLNGSSGSFINLGTNAGPNSVGMVLPVVGGTGSGSGASAGLSIEVVFKAVTLPTNTYRAKIFDWGQGASTDNFGMSFENNALGWCLEAQNNWTPAYTYSRWDVATTQVPTAGVWYHMVWVLSNVNRTSYTSTWTYYIQGTAVSGTFASNTVGLAPLPITRPFSFLGGSDWADANAALMYDVVRVYDYALTASQVSGLYNLYAPPAVSSSTGPYIPPPCPAGSNAGAGGDGAVMGIVPQRPVYNLNFTQNPACITGLASGWQWAMSDPMDNAATAALHQGVAILAGNSSSWVDLTTASGVQSAGYVIPQWGGPGNSYGNTQMAGWSIEIVVKYNVLPTAGTWAKTFELSDNAATVGSQANNLALSWDNGGDAGDDSGYKLDIEQYTNATASPTASHGIVEMLVPQANTWYHIVLAMAPVGTAGAANWYVYVNGQSLNYATNLALNATLAAINGANYPLYVPRPVSFLGKSAWSDPYVAATIDAFRLYDYVLPANTVNSLSAAYGISAPPPQTSYVFPSSPEASQTTGIVPTAPIFNAPFAQNPTTAPTVGSTTNYQWLAYDPTDTPANQRLHTGLVVINGSTGSFINLGTNAGPNSVGLVLPVIGTAGSGSGASAGLSIEVVFKVGVLPTSTYRAKIFDWGQGASTDNFGMSFENNAAGWCLEAQNNWTPGYTYSRWDVASTWTPQAGVWYHMVWVMTGVNTTGYTSTWTYYIQGTPVMGSWASNTVGLYPLPITRPYSFLGGSDWADSNAAIAFDAVRVYDYALTAAQVAGLYNLYNLGSSTGLPVQPTGTTAATTTPSTAPVRASSTSAPPVQPISSTGSPSSGGSSSSSLSGGAIAGIVIGCVVGVGLLLCVLFFFLCAAGRKSKGGNKGAGSDDHSGDGRYDHVEPSTTGAVGGETHTGEGDVEMA